MKKLLTVIYTWTIFTFGILVLTMVLVLVLVDGDQLELDWQMFPLFQEFFFSQDKASDYWRWEILWAKCETNNRDLNQLDLGFLTFWMVGSELIGSITEGQNTPEDLSMIPLSVLMMRRIYRYSIYRAYVLIQNRLSLKILWILDVSALQFWIVHERFWMKCETVSINLLISRYMGWTNTRYISFDWQIELVANQNNQQQSSGDEASYFLLDFSLG